MTVSTLTIRPYRGPEDMPLLVAIFNASAEAEGLHDRRSVEQLAAWYAVPSARLDPPRDILLAELDGRTVGYGRHSWVDTTDGLREHRVFVFALADHRGDVEPLIDALEARAAEAAAEQDLADPDGAAGRRRVLGTFVPDNQGWRKAAFERRGFAPVRWGFEMARRNLDAIEVPPLPEGLELRPVEGRAGLRRLWDADVEAFRDHWGGFDDSDEAFESWLAEPDLDPTLCVVAWDGDEIAGAVINTINAYENQLIGQQRGWLDSVFVRRPWRRRGLAAALVARSLVLLRERGLDSAVLGVDAENPNGALGVYERAGFVVVSRDVNLRRPWPPRATDR
jgi:ribosomal protein S18 acetylase RimI-like enzyme